MIDENSTVHDSQHNTEEDWVQLNAPGWRVVIRQGDAMREARCQVVVQAGEPPVMEVLLLDEGGMVDPSEDPVAAIPLEPEMMRRVLAIHESLNPGREGG